MGKTGMVLAMLGVIACPITSGDTAFRSARLTIADWFKIDQKPMGKRLALSGALLAVGAVLATSVDFSIIWRYFSWSNQTLAMLALWAAASYMAKNHANYWITAIPATFMSAVSCTYILVAGEGFGPLIARMLSGGTIPEGGNSILIAAKVAYPIGIIFAIACLALFYTKCVKNVAAK